MITLPKRGRRPRSLTAAVALTAIALALLLSLSAAPRADASYRVGLGGQESSMFRASLFQALHIKRVRYLVPWDSLNASAQRTEVDDYMQSARMAGQEVLVSFTAHRGCWANNHYSTRSACRAPGPETYKREVTEFMKRYPQVSVVSPWNEANHASQPISRNPVRAAQYYNRVRQICSSLRRDCTIVALDLLDQSDATSYLLRFRRAANGQPRLWGLHNYSDINRKRTTGTRQFLKAAPGLVWLTETGGIVQWGRSFPYSTNRAKDRIRYMFTVADAYTKQRSGYKSRISRIYTYQWDGESRGARFDAGLVGPDGSRRPSYSTFAALLKRHLK